ncbi:S1 family peptidase [Bradyrhizobium sp. 521_C7_N1_3]|uniref:S1 family peptidase n=1 Tax=Bradyrhizobium sp. 521_C7_N1_3 TaxID=3240368 RepID=UPI003F8BD606
MKSRPTKPTKAKKRFKKLKQLSGESAELSQIFNAACEAVFPILKKIDGRDAIIGTGFFIAQNIFVTARHVLEDEFAEGRLKHPIGAIHIHSGGWATRWMTRGAWDANSDVAVCVLQPMHKDGDPLTNKVLPLRASIPEIGAFATAFAYPNHDYFDGAISLWPSAYPGKLLEVHADRGPSVKLKPPYFQTDMHLHPTASGAPVFDDHGRVWGVCSCSYDGATDVSFVTAIAPILGLLVDDVVLPPESSPRSVTVAELAHRGHITIHDFVAPEAEQG